MVSHRNEMKPFAKNCGLDDVFQVLAEDLLHHEKHQRNEYVNPHDENCAPLGKLNILSEIPGPSSCRYYDIIYFFLTRPLKTTGDRTKLCSLNRGARIFERFQESDQPKSSTHFCPRYLIVGHMTPPAAFSLKE